MNQNNSFPIENFDNGNKKNPGSKNCLNFSFRGFKGITRKTAFLFSFLFVAMFNSFETNAQGEIQMINSYLEKQVAASVLESSDIADWAITDQHVSRTSQVHHVYYRQKHQGLEVFGANSSVHILSNGNLLKTNNGFVNNLASKISGSPNHGLTPVQAIIAASNEMHYSLNGSFEVLEEDAANNKYLISDGGVSLENIPAKLMYAQNGSQYVLVWNISIYELDAQNWWEMQVDANTGNIVSKNNWVITCDWSDSQAVNDYCSEDHTTHKHSIGKKETPAAENFMPMVGAYRVYPYPVESPDHGVRSLISNPDNATASPFGWHDTNGAPGAESTLTIGNNVLASEDTDGNNIPGFSPDGTGALIFDFPIDLSMPPNTNFSPNITNLFYWNNIIHDAIYLYGFDEAGGNFQENNYGNPGLGSDFVNADAQNPGNCNANMGTPPDGSNPRMQMFNCNNSSPAHDGDLDNAVIVHEYAHGISNRLTGGPGTSSCLNNQEQMGEGWSDYYGIWFTLEPGDAGTDSRPIGTYLFGQPANGPGIRAHPYDTDIADNPHTYNSIIGAVAPHGVGSVWCMMLWEMTWEIIGTVPFDADIYNGTGGNNIAMALVTEGMKLQPCQPGFVDGRDAILAADIALFGGAYQCEIWTAFAKRGLGQFANQGSPFSKLDGTQDFTIPPGICGLVGNETCLNALPVACGDVINDSTVGTANDNEPFCVTTNGTGGGLWYDFVGTGDIVTMSLCGSTYDTKIRVFTGLCNALVCVTGNDDFCGLQSQVTFNSVPGTVYHVLVHGFGANEGDFTLTVTCAPPLFPNDVCTGALPLTCNSSITGTTVGAGPDVAPTCGTTNGTGGGLWYTFVGDGSCVRLSTCNALTNYDSKLRVYSGTCAALVCVAGDDDDPTCAAGTLKSTVEFQSVAGTTYYVLVHGFGTSEGIFQLDFQCTPFVPIAITCPADQNLPCTGGVPTAASTTAAFLAQGGTISGGSCQAATYTVASMSTQVGDACSGLTVTREYTVTNNTSGTSTTCTQVINLAAPGAPTVTCPADITVACEEDIMLDPNDATVTTDCGLGFAVYIKNPIGSGVPGCNGTVYEYIYKAVDDCGNLGQCSQFVTIVNTPAAITVPAGGNVTCFEDIDISVDDASVTNGCANYNLYLVPPVANGEVGCPGTTYTYTYRLIDECGNVIEEDVVFTNAANTAPTIVAPVDITCECLAGVNPNPDNATVATSCTIGSDVTVTGPQILGPIDCNNTIYRYTYTVTDDCGRTATDTQDFTVQNGPPVFQNCPGDNWLVLNCEDYGGEGGTIAVIEAWIASVSATTSCAIPLTVFNNFNPNNINTCVNNGYNTVTFRATDNCGRTSFCTGVYVVVDTEAPNITTPAQDHYEMCNYNTQANLTAWVQAHGGAVASDGCSAGNISWQASPANPQINCIGAMGTTTVTVQFIVTDNCGNKTNTTATFNALMAPGNDLNGDTEDQLNQENGLTLFQNRPNPFMDETVISFNLPEAAKANLTIYDINGRALKVVEGNFKSGYNEVSVNRNELGATGVMYFRLMTDKEAVTKTMLVID